MLDVESQCNVLILRVLAQIVVTVNRAKCLDFAFLKQVTTDEDIPENDASIFLGKQVMVQTPIFRNGRLISV